MSFFAKDNLIRIDKNGVNIWDTNQKMPHIVDISSGSNWMIPQMPITITNNQYICNSSQNHYIKTGPMFKESNGFIFGYIRVRNNANRTEVNTQNPIFVMGSLCMRVYVENNGYCGSMILTPRVWDGYIGFNVEHTYNFVKPTPPSYLFINSTNTACNPEISIDYTLYYGRFL